MRPWSHALRAGIGLFALAGPVAPVAALSPSGHRHHARPRQAAPQPSYGQAFDPRPTCRYADGTPFDPDIIGGPNHVGDGGPGANLGGYDPCGF